MRKFIILLLSFLCLSVYSGFSQVPEKHPARQMRKYYADVYTGASILEYQAESLDSILFVVSQFIEPAQVISVYSYKSDPYKYRNVYGINHQSSSGGLPLHRETLEKVTYGYASVSGFYVDMAEGDKPRIRPFTCRNPR